MKNGKHIPEMLLQGWSMGLCLEVREEHYPGESRLEWTPLRAGFVQKESFWAYSLHHNLENAGGLYLRSTLAFGEIAGIRFLSRIRENTVTLATDQLLMSPQSLSLEIVMTDNYEEIYGGAEKYAGRVREAVAENANLKCAFLDGDGFWHICHLHIPYALYDSGKIYFQTEPFKFQPVLLSREWRERIGPEMEALARRSPAITGMRTNVSHAQYVIDLAGRFTDMASQIQRTWHDCGEIRIFKEKLPANTERIAC